jgi:hypothetical protein
MSICTGQELLKKYKWIIIYNLVWLNIFITLFDSTEETYGKKLLFQEEKQKVKEIHTLHTNPKKATSYRLIKDNSRMCPSH